MLDIIVIDMEFDQNHADEWLDYHFSCVEQGHGSR